jgi:hypothetical protein
MKQTVTSLKITKRTKPNPHGLFIHVFEWGNLDGVIQEEIRILGQTPEGKANETYNIEELIAHKNHCCFKIEASNFVVNEVYVDE